MSDETVRPVQGRFRTADGPSIHFEVYGSGPPVYICHGGPNATFSYLRQALRPMEQHFTLVFHDYRGSGRSDRAVPSTYRFDPLAADLDALRGFLGHDRIAVLAHSLGGFLALHYALRYGQHLNALVLVATTPCGSMGRLVWPTLRVLGARRIARLMAAAIGYGLRWSWRPEGPAPRRARHRLFGILQEGRVDRIELVRAAERAAAIENDNAPYLEAEAYRTDLTLHLHLVRCPVLVICGSRDAVFYAALALYREHCPSARIVTFPGVGHHPAIEDPEAFLQTVAGFLQGESSNAATSGYG